MPHQRRGSRSTRSGLTLAHASITAWISHLPTPSQHFIPTVSSAALSWQGSNTEFLTRSAVQEPSRSLRWLSCTRLCKVGDFSKGQTFRPRRDNRRLLFLCSKSAVDILSFTKSPRFCSFDSLTHGKKCELSRSRRTVPNLQYTSLFLGVLRFLLWLKFSSNQASRVGNVYAKNSRSQQNPFVFCPLCVCHTRCSRRNKYCM